MSSPNIVLVGFMGSGKSVTAKQLSARLGWERLSTDELIAAQQGQSIAKIFAQQGEAYFRNIEKALIAELAQRTSAIIDCGGGVVLDPDNLTRLKAGGRVFYLQASAEALYENVRGKSHRPLLNVSDPLAAIRSKLKERQHLYEQADEIIISEGRSIAAMTQEILQRMGLEERKV